MGIHGRRYVLFPGAGALHIGSGPHTLRRQSPLPTPYSSRTTRLGLRLPSMMSIERRDTPQRTLSEGTGPLGASPDALLESIELVYLVTFKLP